MDFNGLVDRYEKPIFNLVFRLVGDREQAADITQDTFVAAYRSFAGFRGESAEYTWLYRIAVNLCKNKFKENDRRKELEGLSLDAEIADSSSENLINGSSINDRPDTLLQRKELKTKIEQAISQLPPDYRVVAVLRDLQGLSYQEIAVAADLSIDVVRTRLARARNMLRRKLQDYLVDETD